MENKNINSKHLLQMMLQKKKCLLSMSMACMLISSAVIMISIDPLSHCSRYISRMSNGSMLYDFLKNDMEGVSIEIYLFNITNADRFMSGEDYKLKLEEVGPFVYRQTRTNKDFSIDDEKHTMKFTPSNTNTFDPEASVGDPTQMYLTLPNIPLLLITSKLSNNFFARNFLNLMMSSSYAPILNITVQDYLWGYNDPLITLGHKAAPGIIHFEKLGLLDRFFDPLNFKPLEMDATDDHKFSIKKLDGLGGLRGLGYTTNPSSCNSFNDTYEGIVFPYKLSPARKLSVYHNIYCRKLELDYSHNEVMEYGSEALVYKISDDAFTHNEKNDCLCPYGGCVDGLSDLSPCFFDLPLALSLGHFLNANKSLFDRIEGLNPDEAIHGSQIHVDKEVGIALGTRFTIQYNLMVGNVNYNKQAKPFSNMVVPFIWIKVVQPPLPDDVILNLKILNLYMPKVMIILEIFLVISGICLFVYAYRQSRVEKKVWQMNYANTMNIKDILTSGTPLMVINETVK